MICGWLILLIAHCASAVDLFDALSSDVCLCSPLCRSKHFNVFICNDLLCTQLLVPSGIR
jgi:hypothetical protein